MKHCLTFLPDAYLATKIPDMSGKNLTYGNPNFGKIAGRFCIVFQKYEAREIYNCSEYSRTAVNSQWFSTALDEHSDLEDTAQLII